MVCRTASPPAAATAPPPELRGQLPELEPWQTRYPSLDDFFRLDDDAAPSTSGPPVTPFVREPVQTYTRPSIRATGTLRPAAEWYPAWMQYRRREDNYVFWQDKFMRCSTDIPWYEKRWTVFSTVWYTVLQFRFYSVPPALRFLFHIAWREALLKAYEAHKAFVLWQCKFDAFLAGLGSGGRVSTFSRTMALRRLHLKSSLLGEVLYAVNLRKTGRVHLLPPEAKPMPRPTFFFLF